MAIIGNIPYSPDIFPRPSDHPSPGHVWSHRSALGGVLAADQILDPYENHRKTMGKNGKKWENHRKTMGKPWENHRKTIGKP